nr:hypothetical protein [uncultured Flavobacterium sp.]
MKNRILLIFFFALIICNVQNKVTEFKHQYDQEKVNTAGQREGELIHSYDEKIEYKHIYKAGKLVKATNYRLTVGTKKF